MLYSLWEESLPLGAKRRVPNAPEGSSVESSIRLTGLEQAAREEYWFKYYRLSLLLLNFH